MEKSITDMVFILDKSGSMSGLEKDTIGGFNSLLKKQKKEEGQAFVTTVFFNSDLQVIHDRANIKDVRDLTEDDYICEGMTALLDAVGSTIDHIKNMRKFLKNESKADKTVFVITTDGLENSSEEYSYSQVKKMIEREKNENGWQFIFLGANIDSEKEAQKMGIDRDFAVDYKCDGDGTKLNYKVLSETISMVRNCDENISANWKKDIEKDYKKRKK